MFSLYIRKISAFLYIYAFSASISASHKADTASLGIRQSPRGDSATEPTLGPSGSTGKSHGAHRVLLGLPFSVRFHRFAQATAQD